MAEKHYYWIKNVLFSDEQSERMLIKMIKVKKLRNSDQILYVIRMLKRYRKLIITNSLLSIILLLTYVFTPFIQQQIIDKGLMLRDFRYLLLLTLASGFLGILSTKKKLIATLNANSSASHPENRSDEQYTPLDFCINASQIASDELISKLEELFS